LCVQRSFGAARSAQSLEAAHSAQIAGDAIILKFSARFAANVGCPGRLPVHRHEN